MTARAARRRFAVWIAVAVGAAILLLANAHLVYVAVSTHPECMIAEASSGGTTGSYRPAVPGC